jgi:hypothetical protein
MLLALGDMLTVSVSGAGLFVPAIAVIAVAVALVFICE